MFNVKSRPCGAPLDIAQGKGLMGSYDTSAISCHNSGILAGILLPFKMAETFSGACGKIHALAEMLVNIVITGNDFTCICGL